MLAAEADFSLLAWTYFSSSMFLMCLFYRGKRAALPAASDRKHCVCYVWGLSSSLPLAGAWVTLSLPKVRNYAVRPRNFGTPPLYNPKCQHCPLYQPHGDVHMPLWVKAQYEEIPEAEKTTRGPFKSTLPRCCAKRERALINNNTALRSRFYRIQIFTAASARKRWGSIYDI